MENQKKIYKALAEFQQEVPVIHKGTQGYGYSYTDLPAIFEIINPLLKKHGLGFTQLVNDNCVETILFHVESGETIKSCTTIPQEVQLAKMNQFQVLGSAITYIRRYALSAMLGLVTDKDTDASGKQEKEIPVKWLTEKQLENTIKKDNEYIQNVLKHYDGRTIHKDDKGNKYKASMKKEFKQKLITKLKK